MGIYYDPDQPAIVPDGFLSIGIPRLIDEDLRRSYVLWEEQKLLILVLEIVSKNYREEHTTKSKIYSQKLGFLQAEKQRLEIEEKAQRLTEMLKQLGVDPNNLT